MLVVILEDAIVGFVSYNLKYLKGGAMKHKSVHYWAFLLCTLMNSHQIWFADWWPEQMLS